MNRKLKPLDLLKGYKVVIKDHVVKRYMERAGVSEKEARTTLERKFRNSSLSRFKPDGSEMRSEISGSLNKRLQFVAIKKGRVFIVITCYLQGSKRNFWKNEGLVTKAAPRDPAEVEEEITKEMESYFQEALN